MRRGVGEVGEAAGGWGGVTHEEEIMKLKEKIVLTERLSGENDRTVNFLAPNLLCIHVALRLDLS